MKCISIFKCNPQIEVIDKSHCNLEDVPNFQSYSRSLEELFLDANKLTLLNENVFRLTRLRRFSFSDNAIQDIPPDIAKLVNLVELDCSRNRIREIPEQIKFLRGLQVCDFSGNEIEVLPNGLVQLRNLTHLTLNYCPIKILPEDIGLLKNLESLELRENEIDVLPASITSLESLKKLDLGGNQITRLPDDIGRLRNLEYLLVDANRLETVPPKIGHLENLQCLDLSKQDIGLRFLPDEIGGLISLTDLHISDNHIETLPDGICDLKSLTIFKADSNFLSELNPNIGGCELLQELVLTSNEITKLPSSIGRLSNLRSLNVDDNVLKELTPQIGNMKRLGILSLRDNLLTHLPNEIGQLDSVKVIDLSGNRLEYLPVSITALNLNALWLSKNQAQPLPRLQIDELPNSGTRVLTCYLLPQQNETADTEAPELNDLGNIENNRQVAVSFDTAAIDDADLAHDAQFVRHDTPHPRDLRARHQKLFNNVAKPELRGHDNASFNMADNSPEYNRDYNHQNTISMPSYQQYEYEYESNGLPEFPSHQKQQSKYNDIKVPISTKDNWSNGQVDAYDQRYPNDNNTINSGCFISDIVVRRSKNHKPGLGLSIAGGKDTPPFKDNDEGIFVSKVTSGGPAEAAGIKIGDKILAVNNRNFYEGITHHEAVEIFKGLRPDCSQFTMRILRDPNDELEEKDFKEEEFQEDEHYPEDQHPIVIDPSQPFARTTTIPVQSETNGTSRGGSLRYPPATEKAKENSITPRASIIDGGLNKNIIYTTLVKDYKHDLGLVLENRVDEGECRAGWSNIVISHVLPGSLAFMDGKLQVGDRLLSINGADVTGIDLDRIKLMLNGTERFIRIVVSRGDMDDPIGSALRNMPLRPTLGSWFSSTSNMANRPSLIESYQRPTFGSVSNLQKQQASPTQLPGVSKPPKPPKPAHLLPRDSGDSPVDEDPIARPRSRGSMAAGQDLQNLGEVPMSDAERRAVWRRERLKSIEDDVEMAKIIAEAQRRKREEK